MEDKAMNSDMNDSTDKYVKFSKDFMYVETGDRNKVNIPDFINKAFNRYRWNIKNKTIEKQCYTCKEWFTVLKLVDKKLIDIHDENEIHLIKGVSGFSTRCITCEKNNRNKKVEISGEIERAKNEKQSVYFKAEYKEYLNKAAILRGISIADILNKIIEREMKEYPLEKLLEKFNDNIRNKNNNKKKK